jgi:hypothetical protein
MYIYIKKTKENVASPYTHIHTYIHTYIHANSIELLELIKLRMGVEINYVYPCRKSAYENKGKCSLPTRSDAMEMLSADMGDYFFGGGLAKLCPDENCLVAAAVKIDRNT